MAMAAALALTACTAVDGESDDATQPEEDGGVEVEASPDAAGDDGELADQLTLAIDDEFPTLAAPWGYQPQTSLVLRNIHEALLDRDSETAELIPGLATEWEAVDEVTWRFTLRQGVSFHDGSPFNAEAAAFSINDTYAEENAGEPAYSPISARAAIKFEARVVDEYTIDLVSDEPNPLLLAQVYATGISSMEQLQERPESFESEPIGTGPYRFVEWQRGSGYTLEVNDDWWGWDSDDAQHKPSYQRVVFLVRPEVSSRIAAVRAGEADFAWDLPAEECQAQLDESCVTGPNPTVSYVRIDTPHPTLGDPRVKEALAISIDREAIGEQLLGGAPPASQMDVEGTFGYVGDIEPFEYDPERAAELLAEAEADGVDLDIEIRLLGREASFAGDEQVLEVLQAAWTDLGLNISAEMMETAAYNDIYLGGPGGYEEGRAALFLLRWPNDTFDVARTIQSAIFCDANTTIECHEDLEERAKDTMSLVGEEREPPTIEVMRDFNKNMDYFYIIPVNELRIFHGLRDGVEWTPRPDIWLRVAEFSPR